MAVDPLAPFIRNVVAPLWARWERSPYLQLARHLRQTQFDTTDAIDHRQWHAVQALQRHAYETVPFWRKRMDECAAQPQTIRGWNDFHRVPILTKRDLRNHEEDLLSSQFARSTLHRKTTSGSTGVSVAVYVDETASQFKRACTLRSDEWSGWRLGEPSARVWGNPEYLKRGWRGRLRNALLDRARYLDTLKMDAAAMHRFADAVRRRPPALLFGHAHSLYLFAEFLRQRGGAGFQPRGIISTAMVLHAWERAAIEEVFSCSVTNRYGCEEVSLIACECPNHEGLHVNADGVLVELLDTHGHPVEPGAPGRVVVTDLVNRAMPLLRYEVGDVAVWAGRSCSCGRGLPLLERVEGRAADYVVTPDGNVVSGISLTENFAMLVPGIAQLQVVQERIDLLHLRIVRGSDYTETSLQKIEALVRERFGPQMQYQCSYVERIEQEPSGKFRFCISKVRNPFLNEPASATL